MNVDELLAAAQRQGIELWLDGEQLHYRASSKVSEELKARLRSHKADIIRILQEQAATASKAPEIPAWCSTDCPHFDLVEPVGAEQASVPGCFREDERGGWIWSRLDKLSACPVIRVDLPRLPEWCSRQCPHYQAALKGELLVERCHWRDETGRHWLRVRIEQLRRCPMEKHKGRKKGTTGRKKANDGQKPR